MEISRLLLDGIKMCGLYQKGWHDDAERLYKQLSTQLINESGRNDPNVINHEPIPKTNRRKQ